MFVETSLRAQKLNASLLEGEHAREYRKIAFGETVELTCEGILEPGRRLAELEGLAEALRNIAKETMTK